MSFMQFIIRLNNSFTHKTIKKSFLYPSNTSLFSMFTKKNIEDIIFRITRL